MPGRLTWQNDERCVVGDLTFQILPADFLDEDQPRISMEGADFLLLKHRTVVERYAELVDELRPQRILELGILEGGSTALLTELAEPRCMVAIDRKPPNMPALHEYVSGKELEEGLRIHDDVDQADRRRLAAIAEDAFASQPMDLVVDDCSHMYEATRASFNELFPRLRPGGVYVIEDWDWTRDEKIAVAWANRVPLSRLIVELVHLLASGSGVVSEITVAEELVQVRRGTAAVGSRGRDLLDRLEPSARSYSRDVRGATT